MKPIEPIKEDHPVEVGKFYHVTCAVVVWPLGTQDIIPIIGIHHNDAALGFNYGHYHIDGRFAKRNYCGHRFGVDREGRTNNVVHTTSNQQEGGYVLLKTVVKKLKCKSTTTGIKVPYSAFAVGQPFGKWAQSMEGKSCKGKRCPHLGTAMVERDGQLVCPLHDLRGCVETEVIVPYPREKLPGYFNPFT